MSVFDNMAFGLKLRKTPKAEIEQKVKDAAETLGISPLLDRKPKALSGGQRQRVAVGRAIVRDPAVFLFDEPLSNLDAKLRVIMRAELRHLQQQLGVTTIYVTHDQAEAMTLADKLIVMDAGRIQQVGRSEDVYRYPLNKFVAGFIGSPPMNFVDCRLDMTKSALVSDAIDRKLEPDVIQAITTQGSDKRIIGVRPEDLSVETTPSPGAIQGRVYVMEQLGREILLNALVGDEMVRALVPADSELEAEQQVWLTFDDYSLHIFDGDTEDTLYSGNQAPA